jgi:hypothetical protein
MIKNILIFGLVLLSVGQFVAHRRAVDMCDAKIADAIQQTSDDLIEMCEYKIEEILGQF